MVETVLSPIKRPADKEAGASKRQRIGVNLLLHSDSDGASSSGPASPSGEVTTPKTAEKKCNEAVKDQFSISAGQQCAVQNNGPKPMRLVVAVGGNALQRRG